MATKKNKVVTGSGRVAVLTRVPPDVDRWLASVADSTGRSKSAVVESLLAELAGLMKYADEIGPFASSWGGLLVSAFCAARVLPPEVIADEAEERIRIARMLAEDKAEREQAKKASKR